MNSLYSKRRQLVLAIALCSASFSATADINNLRSLGGNDTAQSFGVFVDSWLNSNSSFANGGSAEEQLLFDLCNDYAAFANGLSPTGSSDQEIAAALQVFEFLTNEEVAVPASGFTDTGHTQIANVLGRLQSLRAGPALASNYNGDLISGGAAGMDYSKLSYYVNTSYGDGEKDRTRNEQGFDFDSRRINFGADYRYADDIVLGAVISFGQSDAEMDDGFGSTESDSLGLTFYGSYYQDDWYAEASLGYTRHNYDNRRFLPLELADQLAGGLLLAIAEDQNLTSSTDATDISWSLGGGYTDQFKGWQTNYFGRLQGVDASIDGYRESGGVLGFEVDKQDVDSLQLVAGVQASKAISKDWGVYSPFISLEMHQEFEDSTRVVTARYLIDQGNNQFAITSDDADDNYFLISAGASFVLSEGRQFFVNLDHLVGLSDVSSNTLSAGIRFEL